ncbi:MAG: crossover junction endodeoxyribonuclease RuvC [Actinomycetota bacterium]|jgi:crossover junction endodeoxyribonuclease RuvC
MFGHVVMGVDPGLTRCGYAVLSMTSAQTIKPLAIGVLRTPPSSPLHERLAEIHAEIDALLTEFSPHAVAVEQVFFQNNVRTAMSVGQASGIVLALAARAGCDVAQYTPSQVKNTVAGWGAATKDQIGRMVQQRLSLDHIPQPADAADAAAIALCHCSLAPFNASRDAALSRGAR